MLRRDFSRLFALVYPPRCYVCGCLLDTPFQDMCIGCRNDIPMTYYWQREDNPVKAHFDGLARIEHGSAFIYFSRHSHWQRALHTFKYQKMWRTGYALARWYGSELKASGLYDDIDMVVPIPLHTIKLLKRGYNQSTYIAEGVARELGVEYRTHLLRRTRNNPSQALNRGGNRWKNAESLFAVRNKKALAGRHILLVDDVLTSGATLCSCINAIHKAVPDCKISVATLYVASNDIER